MSSDNNNDDHDNQSNSEDESESLLWLQNCANRQQLNLRPWMLNVLIHMDLTDKSTFIHFFESEDYERISEQFSLAAQQVSNSRAYPEETRLALRDHIDLHGGRNYSVPAGIIKRFQVIAESLAERGSDQAKLKVLEWSPILLEICKKIFGKFNTDIANAKKISLIVNKNDVIEARCFVCKKLICIQRPKVHQQRFDSFIGHVLRSHIPAAQAEYNEWKSKSSKKKKNQNVRQNQENTVEVVFANNDNENSSFDEMSLSQAAEGSSGFVRSSVIATDSIIGFDSVTANGCAEMFEDDWININSLPPMLQVMVKNCERNSWGFKGNRFDDDMKDLSAYLYIRMQKSGFEFISRNSCGPSIFTVKSYIDQHKQLHHEDTLLLDEFVLWLKENQFPMEVVLTEDGTKIVPKVEFCPTTNCLTGLVSPIDDTSGFPVQNFFKALTAEDIAKNIATYPVASYVNVILGVPNVPNAPSFLLGYFGTDNSYTTTDVIKRNKYLKFELEKRGVKVLGTSTDGDSRALNALKILMEYGNIYTYRSLHLLANPDSLNLGNIDALHKAKGLIDRLFNIGILMRLGNRIPSVNHLLMVYKLYHKHEHEMTLKDLDITNHMNYQRIEKILDEKIFELLKEIPHAEGTIAYLRLVESIMIAYVRPGVSSFQRLKNAVFSVEFCRQWKQWLFDNNLMAATYTITSNIYESLELNLTFLVKMILDGTDQNIDQLSSQMNERWFRKLRSFTGVESTITNCTMKSFTERIRYVEYEEIAMQRLKKIGIDIAKLESRTNSINSSVNKSSLTDVEFDKAVYEGKQSARQILSVLGIKVSQFRVNEFCSPLTFEEQQKREDQLRARRLNKKSKNSSADNSNSQACDNDVFEVAGLKFSSIPSFTHEIFQSNGNPFRKDKLVNIIYNDTTYVSTDIRRRFKPDDVRTIAPRVPVLNTLWNNETISKGDYVIFNEAEKYYGGLVFTFLNADRSTIKSTTFYEDKVQINDENTVNIILEPLYEITKEGNRKIEMSDTFFLMSEYLCHVKDFETLQNSNIFNLINEYMA